VEILVDDKPYQPKGTVNQTVNDLANEICDTSQTTGARMVVSVRCNDLQVTDEQLDEILASPTNQFEKLEFHTQPVSALAQGVLNQAIKLLDESSSIQHQVADLLDEGQQEPAMGKLQKFLEIWNQVQQSMILSAQALELNLDDLRTNDMGIIEIFESIKTQLKELKEAMEKGDFVVVSDILRYEFDNPISQWTDLLNSILEKAKNET